MKKIRFFFKRKLSLITQVELMEHFQGETVTFFPLVVFLSLSLTFIFFIQK